MKFVVTREVEVDSEEKAAEILRLRDLGFRVLFEGDLPEAQKPSTPKAKARKVLRASDSLQEIRELSGLTHDQIAIELGVTQNTISNWMHGRSVPQPENKKALRKLLAKVRGNATAPRQPQPPRRNVKLTEEERLRIAILREQGETYGSIVSQLNVGLRTVYDVLKDFGLVSPSNSRRKTNEQSSHQESAAAHKAG